MPFLKNTEVSLHEVTKDTVRRICALEVAPEQRMFVAPNAISIAESYFSKDAWFRAIHAGDEPVGFVMLSVVPERAEYFLWRFMIAQEFQRRGLGRRALELVIEHVRTLPGAMEFKTSYVPGDGCPEPFYRQMRFEATGEMEEGEPLLRLPLV